MRKNISNKGWQAANSDFLSYRVFMDNSINFGGGHVNYGATQNINPFTITVP
jgi:hypothetical protein